MNRTIYSIRWLACFFIIGYCLTSQLNAQSSSPPLDTLLFDQAVVIHEKGAKHYGSNLDSCVYLLNEAAIAYKAANAPTYYINELLMITTVLAKFKRFKTYSSYAELSEQEAKLLLGDQDPLYAHSLNNLGSNHYIKGNYTRSVTLFDQALKIMEAYQTPMPRLIQNYQNQANAYIRLGDYTKALQFLEKAIERLKVDSSNQSRYQQAGILIDIGLVYVEMKQWEQSVNYFEQSRSRLKQLPNHQKNVTIGGRITRSLQESTNCFFIRGDYDQALVFLNKTLSKHAEGFQFRKTFTYELKGNILLAKKQAQEALTAFLLSKKIGEEEEAIVDRPPDYARKHFNIAKAYEALQDWDKSLDYCQKGLRILSPSFDEAQLFDNPEKAGLRSDLYALDILELKGRLLLQMAESKSTSTYLKGAMATYQRGIEIISHLRKIYTSAESKNHLSRQTIPIYEGAIKAAHRLYQESGEEQYLQRAFEFAESNKALSLLESINQEVARGVKGLPDSLLEKEKAIQLDIAFFQRSIFDLPAKLTKRDSQDIRRWRDNLFNLEKDLREIVTNFETNYPHFYELKYQQETVDLPALQKELQSRKEALIEYFIGEEKVYVFSVTANQVQLFTHPYSEELVEQINRLQQSIASLPGDSEVTSNYQEFTGMAHQLYQALLQPALKQLPSDIHSLLIIPDYQLNYIPFELLLTEKASSDELSFSANHLAYIMETYQINYDYSAIFSAKNLQRERTDFQEDFVGFAPSFPSYQPGQPNRSCEGSGLYQLECSEQEVQIINDLMNGQILLNTKAEKGTFEQLLPASRIIHLATHACVDANNSVNNRIFLTDDYISSSDLFNAQTRAELVVLSACNTGVGELVKGEGLMSLARGFMQAGSASCVLSRWAVDDCATSRIMQYFYEQLHEGASRHQALSAAKLQYLNQADKLHQHPYYWGAFAFYGKTDQMDLGRSGGWKWSLLLLIALPILLLYFYKKRS